MCRKKSNTISFLVLLFLVVVSNFTAIVYNFKVENNHNYYVGKQSILVHNDCKVVTHLLNDGKLTKAQADDFLKDFGANQTLLSKFGNDELEVDDWLLLRTSRPAPAKDKL